MRKLLSLLVIFLRYKGLCSYLGVMVDLLGIDDFIICLYISTQLALTIFINSEPLLDQFLLFGF